MSYVLSLGRIETSPKNRTRTELSYKNGKGRTTSSLSLLVRRLLRLPPRDLYTTSLSDGPLRRVVGRGGSGVLPLCYGADFDPDLISDRSTLERVLIGTSTRYREANLPLNKKIRDYGRLDNSEPRRDPSVPPFSSVNFHTILHFSSCFSTPHVPRIPYW